MKAKAHQHMMKCRKLSRQIYSLSFSFEYIKKGMINVIKGSKNYKCLVSKIPASGRT